MARFLAKAKSGIIKNIYMYVLIMFIFVTGFSAAVFTYGALPAQKTEVISQYIASFLRAAANGVPYFDVLWHSIAVNVPMLIIIILAGNWILTCPIAFIIVGVKGFYIGVAFMALSSSLPFFSWLALTLACIVFPCVIIAPCYFNACRLSAAYAVAKVKLKKLPEPDQAEYIKYQLQTFIALIVGIMIQSGVQSIVFAAAG